GDPLPLTAKAGLMNRIIIGQKNELVSAIDVVKTNDSDARYNFGIEYKAIDSFAFRAGYKYGYDLDSFTLGAGIKIGYMSLDYGVGFMGVMNYIHCISLNYHYGNKGESL
ncbi:MAG: hypothetical protein Q7J59_06480, partial [Elusimicrobiota bacterium]|nr:hypothetical protein [Elusimicrobiota bacterium]